MSPNYSLVKDKNGDLLVDSHIILNKWNNYFCQLLNIQSVSFKTQPKLLHMNYETNRNIELLQLYPVAAANALLEIGTAVISLDEHLSQTDTSCVPKFCFQSVYCCLVRYCLVRIRIAKCFTNSSKRFRCEVMFENEHTFCS
jgi:hypothetical protein